MNKVYCYPRCTTCKKAVKWLEENGIDYEYKHIVEETPSKEDIKKYYKESGLPLKRFFNTSGNVYKELNLKEKLAEIEKIKDLGVTVITDLNELERLLK